MSYLVIDLSARKTNMLQSLGILTPSPVMPAVMLAHALDRRLQGERAQPALGVKGVGLVHRHSEPWIELLDTTNGYLKHQIVQRRAGCMFDKDDLVLPKQPQQNSMQPMALADMEWTLLLDCGQHVSRDSARHVEDMLRRMRLAGGVIDQARVMVFDAWSDARQHALRTGYWIDDVTADIQGDSRETDPMLAILMAIADRENGWIVPVNLGYALLEVPKQDRRGARDGRPHAFAEHMIGVIRYVPVGIARQRDLTQQNLWRHGWDGDQFLVTNRPSVALSPALQV